jgi:hypothetical protein
MRLASARFERIILLNRPRNLASPLAVSLIESTTHRIINMKMNKKLFKIIGIIAAIVVILVFLDFALGGILAGWNNPK